MGHPDVPESAAPEQVEAPAEAFSHYLTLVTGERVRYDVGNDPFGPLPTSWNGVAVVRVDHAA
jgi:hypothetical protein